MNPKNSSIKSAVVIFGVALILVLGIFVLVFRSVTTPPQQNPTAFPSPTPNPFELSEQERDLPQAKRQAFQVAKDTFTENVSQYETGTLVVTSQTSGVWVYLDPPEDAHAESSTPGKKSARNPAPDQYPPFTINAIPVGKHRLIAAKPDFIAKDVTFEIKKGEVTRIVIDLEPVRR